MQVGDLVRRKKRLYIGLSEEIGIVTETVDACEIGEWDPNDSVWVQWIGKPDWDMEWPSELETISNISDPLD
mgnify:FL=1